MPECPKCNKNYDVGKISSTKKKEDHYYCHNDDCNIEFSIHKDTGSMIGVFEVLSSGKIKQITV